MQFVNKIDHFRSFNFPSFFPSRFSDRASRTKRKFISYSWEKYSPNHPPFISRVYRYLSYPCNVYNPSPPLPPQARKRCIQAFSLIIRFSIVFFASESRAGSRVTGLTCPAVYGCTL